MSRLSIVIFGASGYTGRHAVYAMVKLAKKHPDLTWAVAGRSQSKLESLIKEVSQKTGEDQSHVRVIIADVTDEPSLKAMCSQASVVANCCGPYRLYGEPVVKAAVESNTHVVDVTGEPQFIESMQLKYDMLAREAGVCVVSACGFDSIPNDMGTVYLQDNFGGILNSVESYLSAKLAPEYAEAARKDGIVHYGTWESLVYGLAHYSELKPLRMKLYPEKLPAFKPKLEKRWPLHHHNGWCVPFPGADNSVVYRSQRALHTAEGRRPAQFRAYANMGTLYKAVGIILGAVFAFVMAQFKYTRELLLQYPGLFSAGTVSRTGPRDEVIEHTSFEMELVGEGWEGTEPQGKHNKRVVAKVSGTNPGYGLTAMSLLYCAITILKEGDKIPDRGVLTTAVAFRKTNLIKNLNENGLKFEIVESKTI